MKISHEDTKARREEMKKRIVLLGPPASGKGTQAEKIRERFGIPIVSTGAMFRYEMRMSTPLGIEVDKLTRDGHMAPDRLVMQIVESWLQDNGESFAFDGFPRTLVQAEGLREILAERTLHVVFLFDLTMQTIFERVMNRLTCDKCGRTYAADKIKDTHCTCGGNLIRRSDDTPEALEQRLLAYQNHTEPLVGYYRDQGVLRVLQAADTPENVFAQIQAVLEDS